MKWTVNVTQIMKKRNTSLILVGKPVGKRPPGRPRYRLVDNIKMDIKERGWDDMDCIDLVSDRVQWKDRGNTVMNLRVP
jgi:hypothetical protein